MQTVSRFEANLLRLLYFFLRREPLERALPLIEPPRQPPACLSPTAIRLIQDALTKGCVHLLAERGGWRRERFLRNERPVEGRLWERTPPQELGLSFSRHTLEFLTWIAAVKPGGKPGRQRPSAGALTLGDQLLLFFAHEGLRQYGRHDLNWQTLPGFAMHGLCRLMYPDDFAAAAIETAPNFAAWTKGVGACILEALQNDLAERWQEIEQDKGRIGDYTTMRLLGQEQERVLSAFLDAVEQAERLDLARFLLKAASKLLTEHARAEDWTGALQHTKQRLAERAAIYHMATTFLRQMNRLQQWERQARAIGYFDEGYEAGQLWKSDWESIQGDVLVERARAILGQLDPMRQASIRGHST